MTSLLTMRDISKRFGATQALRGVSLDVRAGEVLALIGENGAGKSTLMKILSGAHAPDSGLIELAGQTYAPGNPLQARHAGMAMIYQELNIAPHLSVEDNILLGQERHRFGWLNRKEQRRQVCEVLALLGHPHLRPETPVQQLSVATQQVIEIARALVSRARLIVFDEPTSSLTRKDVVRLFDVIGTLKRSGIGIIYISHFLEEIRGVCDRYTVLRDGEVAGSGELACVSETEIVSMMVGRNVEDLFPKVPHEPGPEILQLTGLSGRRFPAEVSLSVRRGEILGIAGLIGAGRTELLRCLFGLDAVRSGKVTIGGIQPPASPRSRIRAGMGFVSEDRKGEGLAQARSLVDNLTYSRLSPYSRFGWLNLRRRRAAAGEWMRRLQVKAQHPEQSARELSGGNQQKIAIARVLHQDADILLLDEPTRGIDVGTKAEIYRLIGELAAAGKAVLFVSSYINELLSVCDRVAVMARGRVRDVRPASEWTEEEVMRLAVTSDNSTGDPISRDTHTGNRG